MIPLSSRAVITAATACAMAFAGVVVTPAAMAQETTPTTRTVCTPDRTRFVVKDGTLDWGVREKFRQYMSKPFVAGSIETENGAQWNDPAYTFPAVEGEYIRTNHQTRFVFAGGVHFSGHNGQLDLTLANPQVRSEGNAGQLFVDVSGKTKDGEAFNTPGVHLATVNLKDHEHKDGGVVVLHWNNLALTQAGAEAFQNYLSEGDELDDATITVSMEPAQKCEEVPVENPSEGTQDSPNGGEPAGNGNGTLPSAGGDSTSTTGGNDSAPSTGGTDAAPSTGGADTTPSTGSDTTGTTGGTDNAPAAGGSTNVGNTSTNNGSATAAGTENSTTGSTDTTSSSSNAAGTTTNPFVGYGNQGTDNTKPTCTPDPTKHTVDNGSLNWGVRDSFVKYIQKGPAKGSWTLNGATWNGSEFSFPATGGSYNSVTREGSFTYSGSVRFTGHDGKLDLTFAQPTVTVKGNTGTLTLSVAGSTMEGQKFNLGRVNFATLSIPAHAVAGNRLNISGASATLTAAGAQAFAGFYEAGEALDALSTALTVRTGTTCTAVNTVADGSDTVTVPVNKDNAQATADAHNTATGQATTNSAATADAGAGQTVKPVKECAVDPNKMRVTSGWFSWGVRSSFTSYIRGAIAKGGWDLYGTSWDGSGFGFAASGGIYNTATREGTIYYSGTVHFHGHNGILDLTMSNPAVDIEGNYGALYLTVSGSDTNGKKFDLGRVHFANIAFDSVYAGEGSFEFSASSVTLTGAGAQAFAGFYEAGTGLAALSGAGELTYATACDPETGELIEYNAFGENIGVAGKLAKTGAEAGALVAMSITFLAMGAIAARRRARN